MERQTAKWTDRQAERQIDWWTDVRKLQKGCGLDEYVIRRCGYVSHVTHLVYRAVVLFCFLFAVAGLIIVRHMFWCEVFLSGRLMSYTEQYLDYDPFVSAPEPSNPWIGDDTTFWEMEARFESPPPPHFISGFSFDLLGSGTLWWYKL